MKKILIIIWGLLFLFIVSVGFSLYFMQAHRISSQWKNPFIGPQGRKYHFIVVLSSPEDPFIQGVSEGMQKAAEDFQVAVEIHFSPAGRSQEDIRKYLEIAAITQVDGVLLSVTNAELQTPLIDQLVGLGVPVVTLESDAPRSQRSAFVGTNRFQIGQSEGRLITEATLGQGRIALILDDEQFEAGRLENNLIFTGLNSVIRDYPGISIAVLKFSGTGLFSAEEITKDIMVNHPLVDVILCTNAKDTLAATQAIVDFNKVSEYTILGFDDTDKILDYIRKGVIYGTVARNPGEIGYAGIQSLMELKSQDNTSSFKDTGVNVITVENVHQYTGKGRE